MYGLEKKSKQLFEFDLEKDLKKDPRKLQELLKAAEGKVQTIKTELRAGTKGPQLDQLGVLLQAYTVLQRVLGKLVNKK